MLEINVRSAVDRPFQGWRKAPLKEHGKLYHIVAITEAPSALKLVRPVDEAMLLNALREALAKRGFSEALDDTMPDIILTVLYGRGRLRNPYLDGVMMDEYGDPPIATLTGLSTTHLIRQRTHGYETKLQAAQQEKLFVRISAWAHPDAPPPESKKEKDKKPRRLWKTDMVVDDPANRDLNLFIKEMLAAGSAYFDREMDREEVSIRTDIPEGKVILGEMRFLEEEEKRSENAGKKSKR